VNILLDENFPVGLLRRLRTDGFTADHIITLNWRGASDARIRERLADDQILFLTQDDDFLFGEAVAAVVVVSRVRQSRTLADRIEVWSNAVREVTQSSAEDRLFELTDEGVLMPWRDIRPNRGS
jgi:Domain of unknown function (DUF5615)